MLSGTLDSAASQAIAETPNTTSPSSTHGEVAARNTRDPPEWAAREVAICMPCLSITWPVAAVATANRSSPTLAMVKRRLPDCPSWPGRPAGRASSRSGVCASDDFHMCRSSLARPPKSSRRRCAGRLQPGEDEGGIEVEVRVAADAVPAQPVLPAHAQHAEPVLDAAAQVDRRRVGLVAGRAGHLADPGSHRD